MIYPYLDSEKHRKHFDCKCCWLYYEFCNDIDVYSGYHRQYNSAQPKSILQTRRPKGLRLRMMVSRLPSRHLMPKIMGNCTGAFQVKMVNCLKGRRLLGQDRCCIKLGFRGKYAAFFNMTNTPMHVATLAHHVPGPRILTVRRCQRWAGSDQVGRFGLALRISN